VLIPRAPLECNGSPRGNVLLHPSPRAPNPNWESYMMLIRDPSGVKHATIAVINTYPASSLRAPGVENGGDPNLMQVSGSRCAPVPGLLPRREDHRLALERPRTASANAHRNASGSERTSGSHGHFFIRFRISSDRGSTDGRQPRVIVAGHQRLHSSRTKPLSRSSPQSGS
jgi:hypothetical protein